MGVVVVALIGAVWAAYAGTVWAALIAAAALGAGMGWPNSRDWRMSSTSPIEASWDLQRLLTKH